MSLDVSFTALAEPSRRGVIDLLCKSPRRAGELAEELGLSPAAMSRHLKVLRDAGFVERELDAEDARANVYRLKAEPFDELGEWLEEVNRFWTRQLAAFVAHTEKKAKRDRR